MMTYRYQMMLVLSAMALLAIPYGLFAQGKEITVKVPDTAGAKKQRAALIFGERHALTVRAPEGWVLDTRSGQGQGLQAVFYPHGDRWAKSPAVMYCQVVARSKDIADMAAMIQYDQERFRSGSPSAVVTPGDSIAIPGGRRAPTRSFAGGARGTFEQVAYIEERSVIVLVVLSCRSSELLQRSVPVFRQLVGSYQFLADDEENILRAVEAAEEFGE
jgi:hypothetical protein